MAEDDTVSMSGAQFEPTWLDGFDVWAQGAS